MKAITLHQPWASLIAVGVKQYETRGWPTAYRGTVAIHAGKTVDEVMVDQLWDEEWGELPTGAVVAIADLTGCIRMTWDACNQAYSSGEDRYGDWRPGRFAWKLENVRAIDPIPARGQQGLWDWEGDLR